MSATHPDRKRFNLARYMAPRSVLAFLVSAGVMVYSVQYWSWGNQEWAYDTMMWMAVNAFFWLLAAAITPRD